MGRDGDVCATGAKTEVVHHLALTAAHEHLGATLGVARRFTAAQELVDRDFPATTRWNVHDTAGAAHVHLARAATVEVDGSVGAELDEQRREIREAHAAAVALTTVDDDDDDLSTLARDTDSRAGCAEVSTGKIGEIFGRSAIAHEDGATADGLDDASEIGRRVGFMDARATGSGERERCELGVGRDIGPRGAGSDGESSWALKRAPEATVDGHLEAALGREVGDGRPPVCMRRRDDLHAFGVEIGDHDVDLRRRRGESAQIAQPLCGLLPHVRDDLRSPTRLRAARRSEKRDRERERKREEAVHGKEPIEQPVGLALQMQWQPFVPRNLAWLAVCRVQRVDRWTRLRAAAAAITVLLAGCDGGGGAPDTFVAMQAPEPEGAVVALVTPEERDAGVDAPDALVVRDAGRSARRRDPAVTSAMLFDAAHDEEVLAQLRGEEIVEIERGRGGRSVAFRVRLEGGMRAYFKPEQTFSGTQWYAEIAAFHLDRILRLRRTAPSTGRAVPWSLLEAVLGDDPRASEVIVQPDGSVRGVLTAWIEERLVPLAPPAGWEQGLRTHPYDGIMPYVAAGTLRRLRDGHRRGIGRDAGIDAGADAGVELGGDAGATTEAETRVGADDGWDEEGRSAELSTLIAFDFLTHNGDRWGGGFTNVRTRGVEGPVIYLDNAAGFARGPSRRETLDLRLAFVERFERGFVQKVRRLELEEFRERLGDDPLAPILDETQLTHLEERRRTLIAHIDALIARDGEECVLPW